MLATEKLPPSTRRLWAQLASNERLRDFVLVGGTALTLHLGHRTSEDLDFFLNRRASLPVRRLSVLIEEMARSGWHCESNTPAALIADFEDSGHDWQAWQQDYIAHDPEGGSVKLTFVVPDTELVSCLDEPLDSLGGPRLASIDEIFRLKCIAAANRSKTRDWLDLFLLFQSGRFSAQDFVQSFARAGVPAKLHIALMRMTTGKPQINDEGYFALLDDAPSVEQMQTAFIALQAQVEQEQALQVFRQDGAAS